MKLSEAKARREVVVARDLEIQALLAEGRRAWVVDKIDRGFDVRVSLEAELAQLAVEKNSLNRRISDAKDAMKAYRNSLSHAVLIKLLADRGLSELVVEADRVAADAAVAEV